MTSDSLFPLSAAVKSVPGLQALCMAPTPGRSRGSSAKKFLNLK
jgi:hypothetical protein